MMPIRLRNIRLKKVIITRIIHIRLKISLGTISTLEVRVEVISRISIILKTKSEENKLKFIKNGSGPK